MSSSYYSPESIFKCREEWESYMHESWERGKENVAFVQKNEQYAKDDSMSFEPLTFNFMMKLLQTAKAQAKDLDISLSLVSLTKCEPTETQTFKKLVQQLMMNKHNIKSFRDSLDKVYDFGQAVFHIKPVREDDRTLNTVLKIENIEDVCTTFFDRYSTTPDFHDGNYCGRSYKISASKLRTIYPKLRNTDVPKIAEVIDFWYRNKKQAEYVLISTGEYKRSDLIDEARDSVVYGEKPKKGFTTTLNYVRVLKGYEGFLEKETDIPMQWLPLVFNSGGIVWDATDNKYISYPFGSHLKDAQLMINYSGSVIADLMKTTKGDKWIFRPEHIQGNKQQLAADEINVREGGMIFSGDTSTIRREPSQQLPPGMLEVFQQVQGVIQSLAGSYFENNSAQIKAVSGVALDKLFKRIDLIQNPVIVAHLEAINQVARVLQQMIPIYYKEQRQISIQCEDDSMEVLTINQHEEQHNGMVLITNNIKDIRNKYEYNINIAPSQRLQQQNVQTELQSLYQIFPQAAATTIDLYAKSLDVPVSEVLARRLSSTIPQAIIQYGNGEISYEQLQQQRQQQLQQEQMQQAAMMAHNPQAQALQAKAHRDLTDAASEAYRAHTDAYNAQTERQKVHLNAANDQMKNVNAALKDNATNLNEQHRNRLSLYESMIDHFRALMDQEK